MKLGLELGLSPSMLEFCYQRTYPAAPSTSRQLAPSLSTAPPLRFSLLLRLLLLLPRRRMLQLSCSALLTIACCYCYGLISATIATTSNRNGLMIPLASTRFTTVTFKVYAQPSSRLPSATPQIQNIPSAGYSWRKLSCGLYCCHVVSPQEPVL